MIRVAYGSVPKESGTFTFYRNQRLALLERGIDMRCVSVGAEQARLWREPFADEGCVLLGETESEVKRQSQVFTDWCEQESIDIVLGINSPAILSALPHLPEKIRAMARCANAFDEGYRVTIACYERLAKIVALTPRLAQDLEASYGVDPNRIVLIPNGILPAPFDDAASLPRGTKPKLQLGFLGRLEHKQKGVFFLPEVVKRLRRMNLDFVLRIAGTGKHETQLRKRLRPDVSDGYVTFEGPLRPDQVPDFLGKTDIYLFPSQFEGCPNALLEAMMAGAVPVSWNIHGITDFILDKPELGTLCDLGNCEQFANAISHLHHSRDQLQKMSKEVRLCAQSRFSQETCAERYADLFGKVMDAPSPSWVPKPWSEFKIDAAFEQRGWRRWVGRSVRQFAKQLATGGKQ